MRRALIALVAVGLAVAIVIVWPRSGAGPDSDGTSTTALASATTTSPVETSTTTASSTSTSAQSHVVQTVEEAEQILRELWFGWFEGIYNQDEERIREVVASEVMLEAAVNAFSSEFLAPPERNKILLETELLAATTDCLVTFGLLDVTAFRGPQASASSVQVMRRADGEWRFFTSWISKDDRWESDCEATVSPLP